MRVTTTDNGFTIALHGGTHSTNSLYVYAPSGVCILHKSYGWDETGLAEAEYYALLALATAPQQRKRKAA